MTRGPFVSPHALYADTLHGYLRELPGSIDAKVEIFLAIVLGVLLFQLRAMSVAPDHLSLLGIVSGGYASLVAYAALGCLISSVACGVVAIWPRLSGAMHGLAYFGAIAAKRSAISFAEQVIKEDEQALLKEVLVHCFELARVTRHKVQWFRVSMGLGVLGLVLVLVNFFGGFNFA